MTPEATHADALRELADRFAEGLQTGASARWITLLRGTAHKLLTLTAARDKALAEVAHLQSEIQLMAAPHESVGHIVLALRRDRDRLQHERDRALALLQQAQAPIDYAIEQSTRKIDIAGWRDLLVAIDALLEENR